MSYSLPRKRHAIRARLDDGSAAGYPDTGTEFSPSWVTKELDRDSEFGAGFETVFQPSEPGTYLVSFWTEHYQNRELTALIKKGTTVVGQSCEEVVNGQVGAVRVTAVLQANGSTDFFKVFVKNLSGSGTSHSWIRHNTFTACRIA
jgi:hypothetical protein